MRKKIGWVCASLQCMHLIERNFSLICIMRVLRCVCNCVCTLHISKPNFQLPKFRSMMVVCEIIIKSDGLNEYSPHRKYIYFVHCIQCRSNNWLNSSQRISWKLGFWKFLGNGKWKMSTRESKLDVANTARNVYWMWISYLLVVQLLLWLLLLLNPMRAGKLQANLII